MSRKLDDLLLRLMEPNASTVVPELFEVQLWQRIRANEALTQARKVRLSIRLATVAVAFLVGLVAGIQVPGTSYRTQSLIAAELDVLPINLPGVPQ